MTSHTVNFKRWCFVNRLPHCSQLFSVLLCCIYLPSINSLNSSFYQQFRQYLLWEARLHFTWEGQAKYIFLFELPVAINYAKINDLINNLQLLVLQLTNLITAVHFRLLKECTLLFILISREPLELCNLIICFCFKFSYNNAGKFLVQNFWWIIILV